MHGTASCMARSDNQAYRYSHMAQDCHITAQAHQLTEAGMAQP